MLKDLALTPPVVGRIAIGKVVRKDGKRLPEKDDEFTITSQVQNKDGWIPHPIDETLRSTQGAKLRSIPVRLLFDDPNLNMRAQYTLFERTTGRTVCVGNGESCRRVTAEGVQSMTCLAPDACDFSNGNCKPYGRLNVRIGEDDELGTFIFRTTGFNSIRTLAARLRYFHAVTTGLLSTMPLELRLRGKSTMQSHRAPIYYVDLTVRCGMSMTEAIATAQAEHESRRTAGFNQAALDVVAREGLAAGLCEDPGEEGNLVAEEFFPADAPPDPVQPESKRGRQPSLADRMGIPQAVE